MFVKEILIKDILVLKSGVSKFFAMDLMNKSRGEMRKSNCADYCCILNCENDYEDRNIW